MKVRLPPISPAKSVAAFSAAAAIAATVLLPGFEGKSNVAYWDKTGKVWTLCYGTTKGVKQGDRATDAECVQMAARDAQEHGIGIGQCVRVAVPLDSRVALVSFAYNVGIGNFCKSGVNQALNAGDLARACSRINMSDAGKPQWIYSGGVKLPGLVKRRAAERAYCERGLA